MLRRVVSPLLHANYCQWRDLFMQRIKARMFGATEYLVAPVNEKQLLALLKKYLNFSSIIEYSTIL